MKKIIGVLFFFMLVFVTSCSNSNSLPSKVVLTISADETQALELNDIVTNFNQKHLDEYQIIFDTQPTEEIRNYKLRHNDINADLIAFDSFNTANQFGSDYLIDLTLDDTVEKYQISIINYIKDNNERLFCFPSLGRFYANCYNLDIMNKYNYLVPETLDDELILAKRSELKVDAGELIKTSATVGGDESILFALMQIAFPEFLGTTTGSYFLKEFKKENVNMADAKYSSYFKDIFKKFHQLYYSKYYALADQDKTLQDGLNDFLSGNTMILQTSIDYQYDDVIEQMKNATIYPFAGKGVGQEWIASKPLFYLGVNKNIQAEKYACAKAFFQYFTSQDGQDIMSNTNNTRLSKNKCFISYVKDIYLELGDDYKNILKPIEDGRIFIVDTFLQIFSDNVESLVRYLNNEISIDELIAIIDSRNYKMIENETQIKIEGSFDYDNLYGKKETKISNYLSDMIRKYADVDGVILDPLAIKGNIYNDGLYLSDLDIILEDTKIVYKKLNVKQIKKIINTYLARQEIPIISGIRINLKNDELLIFNQSNQLLNDDDSVLVLIDETLLVENNINCSDDKKILLIDTIKNILSNQVKIVVPSLDNRYGNLDFSKENS